MKFFTFLLASVACLAVSCQANDFKAAPYFMPFESDSQNIDEIIAQSGVRHLILAFVNAIGDGQCVPAWYGNANMKVANDAKIVELARRLRSSGGDIAVSFGGYNGVELGHACNSPQALANAYQQVIDKYDLTYLDFDIEGNAIENAGDNRRRMEAIKILKQTARSKGRNLFVSLTLPTTTVGLNWNGKEEIKTAFSIQHDLIDFYTLMAFDFGGMANNMLATVRGVMEYFHQQLKEIRTDLSSEQVYNVMGMILMNGHTDQSSELFNQQTFEGLVNYASEKGMSRVSFWALNRDRSCPKGRPTGWVASFCSSIDQRPYEFSQIISKFSPSDDHHHHTDSPTTNNPHHHDTTVTTNAPVTLPDDKVDCKHAHEQYFPFKGDCHKYIRCYGGVAHLEVCPSGTIYDIQLRICNWQQDVNRPECK